jgi:glycerol-3-phosphate dehydrogenase
MWDINWRNQIWSSLPKKWDVVIIGGGITGAGIFSKLSRHSYKVLLLEANDFSSGTSSRSSKLVHGGFRYLKNGQISLTIKSVRERERLLSDARGLINPLAFLMACYKEDQLRPWMLEVGLSIYDLLACKWGHQYYSSSDFLTLCPYIKKDNLLGGFRFFDALTDDARLVYRIIKESSSNRAIKTRFVELLYKTILLAVKKH